VTYDVSAGVAVPALSFDPALFTSGSTVNVPLPSIFVPPCVDDFLEFTVRVALTGANSASTGIYGTCSILAGVDADGNDEVLFGTVTGRVFQACVGSKDIAASSTTVTGTGAITSTLTPRLLDLAADPQRGVATRDAVTAVELEFVDEVQNTSAVTLTYGYGASDGSSNGTTNAVAFRSRLANNCLGTSGIAWGTTLKSAGVQRIAQGVRGASTTGPWFAKITGAPMPQLRGLKIAHEPVTAGI
jgi:hypothetical protein